MVYHLQQILYNCISIEQFMWDSCEWGWKMEDKHYKLYGHPFWRLPKCVMNLFDVAANMTKVVKDIVKVYLLCTAVCDCGGNCEHWLFFIIFPCFTENSLKISLNWSYLDFFRFPGGICFCTVKSHRTSKKLYLLIKLVFKTCNTFQH